MTDTTPVTPSPRQAPDFLHELFWGQIRALLGDELERYQPKMGTVSGTTGASLMVLPDGQSVPRKMPHVAGRRFQIGDRVIFALVKGQWVVIGGVLTATGQANEGVVSMADIDQTFLNTLTSFQTSITSLTNAVGVKGSNAATSTGLWNAALGASEAAAAAKSRADTAFTKADTAQTTADSANTKIGTNGGTAAASTGLYNIAHAADEHAQNVYNQLNQGASDGTQAITRIQQNLNQRMDAACLKACGCKTCNCGTCASGVGS